MFRTFTNLYRADPGFQTDRLLSFTWVMPGRAYADDKLRVRLTDQALEKLKNLPGATSVGLINPLPLSGGGNQNGFMVEGMEEPGPGKYPSTEFGPINPDYFATMQIPVLSGRPFTAADTADSLKVVIIDTTLAEKYFPGQNAVGKRLRLGGAPGHGPPAPWLEIVGVVGHIQNYGIGEPTRYQSYVPYPQQAPSGFSFVLRTSVQPSTLTSAVRAALREIDPALPVFGVRTMQEVFNSTVATQRVALGLLGVFAGLALLLAAIGLYGVLSYAVTQRTREIGVRMAIGADARAVIKLVVFQGLRLAGLGMAIGLGLGLLAARLMQSQLYQVSAFDPASFAAVALLLLVVGLFACLIPAWRATRVNPVEALRTE
jgi:predicted permease